MINPSSASSSSRSAILRVRTRLFREAFRRNWSIFTRSKVGLIGLAIVLFYLLLALIYPIVTAVAWEPRIYDPVVGFDSRETRQPAPPSTRHLLGTDPLGRDVLAQLMASTHSEFMLGVFAAVVTVSIATTIGAASAYFGGIIDAALMRLADLVIMLPLISVLLVLSAVSEVGLIQLALIIGLLGGFGGIGIVLRSQALKIKVRPYIDAARLAGGGPFHIIFVHVVPGLLPFSFLYMMFVVSAAIFSEAILSFLGLMNVRMSWGVMLSAAESRGYLLQVDRFWWLVLPASLSITLLSASFYLIGRGLDEIVNPRLRSR